IVTAPVVGCEQTDLVGNSLIDEGVRELFVETPENSRDDVALAFNCANDWGFARANTAAPACLFVPMPVVILATNECFINFDDTTELLFRLDQCSADFVAHAVRSAVRTEAHHALDLQRAHALLAGQHVVNDAEPVAERLVRVFKDGPGNNGEPIAVG